MAIYKLTGNKDKLVEVDQTSFGQEGVLERADLQRILRDQPQVLEEGLLIISEEFCNWQDSNRRIDLLGLDAEGRLEVWPESHWPGFALRDADVFKSYMAW